MLQGADRALASRDDHAMAHDPLAAMMLSLAEINWSLMAARSVTMYIPALHGMSGGRMRAMWLSMQMHSCLCRGHVGHADSAV